MAQPIAIVGIGARLPGCATVDDLWAMLAAGRTVFREVPAGRWPTPATRAFDPQVGAVDHVYATRGTFLDPAQAELPADHLYSNADPVIRLAVLAGTEAWLDGITFAGLSTRTGVILGNLFLPTEELSTWGRAAGATSGLPPDGSRAAAAPAQALANALGLKGSAYTVDAACASSLYALKLAMTELQSGQADAMLAGGVSRPDCFYTQMGFCQLRALSLGGLPRPLDSRADGMLVGEGAVVFLLKRLADAERDGDAIHGVLRSVGLANDRRGNLLAPERDGQLRAMRAAYSEAGWLVGDVDFIECHATGTPVGDRTELESLIELRNGMELPAVVGSLKANLGHLLTAAGAAALLKVLLAFRHRQLPPQPNFQESIWPTRELRVSTALSDWQTLGRPRRAAVSAFGFGGVDAHLLVEEWHSSTSASSMDRLAQPVAMTQVEFIRASECETHSPPSGLALPPSAWREMLPCQRAFVLLAHRLAERVGQGPEFWQHAGICIDMDLPVEPARYSKRWLLGSEVRDAAGPPLTPERTVGSLGSIVASRVARQLQAGGPAFVVSTGAPTFDGLLHMAASLRQTHSGPFLLGWLFDSRPHSEWQQHWNNIAPAAVPFPDAVFAALAYCPGISATQPNKRPLEALSYQQCLEFARGSAALSLGPRFSPLDAVPVRVRLPDEPLMLVHRVTAIDAEPLSLKPGHMVTEHDVTADAWYLDGGRMPTCIAVEAGQADLLLVGYLGMDLRTKGRAVYRLLDAQITLHRGLPRAGEAVRYAIRITRFQEYGGIWLFFFEYDATVDGQPFLSMRHGCAGFFSDSALKAGEGLAIGKDTRPSTQSRGWVDPPRQIEPTPLTHQHLAALRSGDLAGAFGPTFRDVTLPASLRLPAGRLALIDQVGHWQSSGGRHGRGFLRSSLAIQPDDWHLVCHFKDDPVMPGTLMYECCLHTLRVWLLRAGFFAKVEGAVAEPIPGVTSKLKCRGQVVPTTRLAEFEVHLKETGYNPNVYAIADAILYADGKPIVFVEDLSLQFTGITQTEVNDRGSSKATDSSVISPDFDRRHILEYALGRPSLAFGPSYRVFDETRILARLPSPPYLFVDRIDALEATYLTPSEGARAVAAYDVPPQAWYFDAAGSEVVPFAVLLEVALQPCGWLAAYMGSALTSEKQLCFRNLGGHATIRQQVSRHAGLLQTEVRVTKLAQSLDMFIQHYSFVVREGEEVVYDGTTYFGFFTKAALAQQEGIRGVTRLSPGVSRSSARALHRLVCGVNREWSMLDSVAICHGDRMAGFGQVRPDRWFFAAHFHQDPVWPGSLGLEGFLQTARAWASERWLATRRSPYALPKVGTSHEWVYRGQILRHHHEVEVHADAHATDDGSPEATFDGVLFADGLPIYQMKNFVLRFD